MLRKSKSFDFSGIRPSDFRISSRHKYIILLYVFCFATSSGPEKLRNIPSVSAETAYDCLRKRNSTFEDSSYLAGIVRVNYWVVWLVPLIVLVGLKTSRHRRYNPLKDRHGRSSNTVPSSSDISQDGVQGI